jgi:hypothetical protein
MLTKKTHSACPVQGWWKAECHAVRERFVKGEVFPRCPACEELATWTLDVSAAKPSSKKNSESVKDNGAKKTRGTGKGRAGRIR